MNMARIRTLQDLADWHYIMAQDMYRMSCNAINANWREACYDRSQDHLRVARMLRELVKEKEQANELATTGTSA